MYKDQIVTWPIEFSRIFLWELDLNSQITYQYKF